MIKRGALKEIILDNRSFIEREIISSVERDDIKLPRSLNKVVIFYGVRRSGKTFLLYDLFRRHIDSSLYIDFEDERLKDFRPEDFEIMKEVFLELFPELLNKKKYFFLDEVQNIAQWEKFCRRAVERENIAVFAAGSSSQVMPGEIHTALRGREWSMEITPFSFREYLKANGVNPKKEDLYGSKKVIIKKHFSQYQKWGGFPEVVFAKSLFEKRKILKEYFGAMFFKDLVDRFNMSNTVLIEALTDKLFSSFSQKLSLRAFARQYKGIFPFSRDSLYEYYKNVLKSGLIYEIKKFAESPYKRRRNPAKIYTADTGLARRVTSADSGKLLENLVFLELRKAYEGDIYYFEGKRECDFVVREGNGFSAYQVCFELSAGNREREINGLVECCKWLKKKKGVLLTAGQEERLREEGIEIAVLPVWRWLLAK